MTVYGEEIPATHVYYYEFLNADILVTALDNTSINSITIQSKLIDSHPIRCVYPLNEHVTGLIGDVTVTNDMVERCINSYSNYSARDAYFCIEMYYGNIGRYNYYTFFGNDIDKVHEYMESNNPAVFLDSPVYSFCISSTEKLAPYIGL